ncbi:hypothetical protein HGM15179_019070, partial [Zosterops borbonicus]
MEPEEGFNGPPGAGARSPPAAAIIIGAEDEDFENDIEPTPEEQNSQFQSLELLRQHPLSLMAFLQHVVLQFDSCPVLCYLHVDMMRRMNPKEGRKQFLEFCHLFLDKTGLLRVPIPHHVQFELERTRPELLSEETQRRFLQDIQNFQEPEISRQLEDFRSKRLMGMTPGEQELSELERSRARDPSECESKEKLLAEQLLARLEEMHLTISSDEEKSSLIFGAIVTYMKFLGVRTKGGDAKKSKSNFFRKKISGKEPQAKARKGFSLPGAALWGRDAHGAEFRQSKGPEGEGTDPSGPPELGDPPPEPPQGEQPAEEGPESESLEPGGPGGGDPPPPFLPRQPEEALPRLEPELEQEPPAWRELAAPDALLRLPQREVRRQEVINELFLTEHAHVRMLRVLLELFYQPMLREGFFDEQELSNIFPSLEDLKLKDYQRRLDLSSLKQSTDPLLSEFKNTDITKRTLVHEGPLTWRVTRDKAVEVQVLLLDDLLVLLQRQEERLVLRCHSRALAPAPDGKQMLSPVIRLRSAMTREVATDHKAFYVIVSWENGAQIYELVAQSVSDRK